MRIGEVARRSGVSARMLRHYDSLGLARPSGRSSAGYREYSADDIAAIFHVESLRALGLSLREVRQALDDPDFRPADLVADLALRAEARIARERELLSRLRQVADAGPDDWEQVLGVVALLSGLESADAASRQRAALTVSGTGPPPDALVGALLSEENENVAGALRWAVVRSGADVVPILAEVLTDSDAHLRRRAVLTLVDINTEASSEALRSVVGDPDPTVRSRATQELAVRGDAAVIPLLIERVIEGVADVDASEALAAVGDPAAVVRRLAVGLDAADACVRRRIAQALGEIGGPDAREVLQRLVDDPDRGTAVTARYLVDSQRW
ncbi:HEAT repeat domain-containing protein [Gordonia sp. PDNC005]|uniref:HEAT repeat domain-containing protein n=1 Tax=unclassified Gordonia (in: high G+C Gram-positive bacteria) TaxID=2657482 RepID=UPI001963A9DC|nr:HEAT repeat domain-containing protein [Gordonia sp. PDNC005]QRY62054.1 HEAT repeat domain-containing protein [Gordonia sp. PDNC005]